MLIGLLAALTATVLNSIAGLLESAGARYATHRRPLGTQPRYLVGLMIDGLGWVCTVVALRWLPVFVVQAVLGGAIALTAIGARLVYGSALRQIDRWAIVGCTVGLVLIASSAGVERPVGVSTAALLALFGAAGLLTVALVALRPSGKAWPLGVVAGLAFGGTSVAVRAVHVSGADQLELLSQPAVYAVLVYWAIGMIAYSLALALTSVARLTAVLLVTEIVAPGLVGIALLGDSVRSGWWPVLAAGLVLTVDRGDRARRLAGPATTTAPHRTSSTDTGGFGPPGPGVETSVRRGETAGVRLLAHPDHLGAGGGGRGAAVRGAGRRGRRGLVRGPAGRGRPHPAGPARSGRHDDRAAARGPQRAHRGARVRRSRLVDPGRRHLVHRLGRPAALPARPGRRARADQPRTGRSARADRYADGELDPDGAWIVCVRERHAGPAATDVRNEIVRLDARAPSEPEVLVSGPDFVAAPRWHPNGVTLAWLQWNHPSMPWDDVQLRTRNLVTGEETVVSGGPGESVSEPRWCPDGSLWFLSDRSDWWNLYRWRPGFDIEAMVRQDAEIGLPAWAFGGARYALLDDGRVVFARRKSGFDSLAVRATDGRSTPLDLPFSSISAVRAGPGSSVVLIAGSPRAEPGVYRVQLGDQIETTVLRPPRDLGVDPGYLPVPEPVSFPSTAPDGAPRTAHALFYPPTNPEYSGLLGERPPLLVVIHGGPTSAAVPVLSPAVGYWTSRGFAVVDVNYGGSTGYGRPYREELYGQWGVVDVADCLAAAGWLAGRGRVDGARLCIRGGSAGGFTTLAALARPDTPFAAGADHYGVADLTALAAETHKFESRYLDRLVGPYPEERDTYLERSPIQHVERFTRPLIVLQGAEDRIVPPNQSEKIVDGLRDRGVPVAYLLFDGEQHGFRRAENIRRALDAELSFYAQVLGFELPEAEGIEPVEIENI